MFAYVSDIYGLVSRDNIYRYHIFKKGPGGSVCTDSVDMVVVAAIYFNKELRIRFYKQYAENFIH